MGVDDEGEFSNDAGDDAMLRHFEPRNLSYESRTLATRRMMSTTTRHRRSHRLTEGFALRSMNSCCC